MLFLSALIHTRLPELSIGRMAFSYIHLQDLDVRPHVGPTAFLHCIGDVVAFLAICFMCSLKLSLESRCTPRNFVALSSFNGLPSRCRLEGNSHFLRQVNIITLVFRELMFSPLFLHHLLIVLIDFCVLSWITSRSLPSASMTRSSAKA